MHDPCGKPSSRDRIPAGSRLAPLEQAMGSTTGGHDPEGLLKAERHLGCEEPLVTSDSPNTKGPGGDPLREALRIQGEFGPTLLALGEAAVARLASAAPCWWLGLHGTRTCLLYTSDAADE